MLFRPRRWPGVLTGAGSLLLLLALDGWLALCIARRTPDTVSFLLGLMGLLSVPLVGALGCGLYGLLSLTYHVNRNRVLIRSGTSEWAVPLEQLVRVVDGSELPDSVKWRGVKWPGYTIGRGKAEGWGPFLCFATEPRSHQLLLVTSSLSYAISPRDPAGFLSALDTRRKLGVLESVAQREHELPLLSRPLIIDWAVLWLVLTGLLANAALFGVLCWGYVSLPPRVPLHFDALGQVDRMAPRTELFRLPLVGLLALLANGLLGGLLRGRQPLASYLLLGGAVVLQVLLGVGLWSLMH